MCSKPRPNLRSLLWVPSLYLAMGIPYNVVNGTAVRMYKSLGYADSQITVAVGSIGIAWSLKPLWAAFLDMYRTKKFFVLSMGLLIAGLLLGVAMSLPVAGFFQISIAILWIAAFASSSQDICGDGIYLTALDKPTQARLAGTQSMFWILGKVLAAGILISVLDRVRAALGWSTQHMWQTVMITCASGMVALVVYHFFLLPPGSVTDRPQSARQVAGDFIATATTFFHKRAFWGMIAFVFLYRLGEGLILQEGQLFLQSAQSAGGLGLSAGEVSNIEAVYGTVTGIIGGLIGGWFAGRLGLSRSLWILGLFLNIPHFTYIYLSHFAAAGHGLSYGAIVTMVSIEKFGYGFGMVGNMIYMMQQIAPGRCTMTHYAFATALMNLVLVPTAMISGPLAEWLGFSTFFLVVMLASIPSVLAAWRAPFPLPDEEGRDNGGESSIMVTIDDPTRLGAAERTVQALAGRASIYAMLSILAILILDAKILGSLQGRSAGNGKIQFALLLGVVLLKGYFAWRTYSLASEAAAIAGPAAEANYLGNARGAKIATLICAVVTVCVLAFAARMAF
ncbi:MAG TPA: MFS transporter [Opitutaceae bacterium]|nr:MFS transporter [Opitutaceae bacterium]